MERVPESNRFSHCCESMSITHTRSYRINFSLMYFTTNERGTFPLCASLRFASKVRMFYLTTVSLPPIKLHCLLRMFHVEQFRSVGLAPQNIKFRLRFPQYTFPLAIGFATQGNSGDGPASVIFSRFVYGSKTTKNLN